MIEVSMCHQDRLRAWRELAQSIVDTRSVWSNGRTKRNAQKIHAREVRIDKQGVALGFELVTIGSKISHAHAVARSCTRVANRQVRILPDSSAKSRSGEYQKQNKTQVTTDNADTTDSKNRDGHETK